MKQETPAKEKPRNFWLLAGLACTILPCIPLLFHSLSHHDWKNHIWLVNYYARFFSMHGSFPNVVNTFEASGICFPVFYGYLFYRTMGLISTFFDANITLRFCIIAALAAQFVAIYYTVLKQTQSRLLAFTIGTFVSWSVYPLTALYTRAAIPEFFSCTFLTIACPFLICAANAETKARQWVWNNFAVLCVCAAAGTHPITAMFGTILFLILILAGWFSGTRLGWKSSMISLLVPSLIASVCLLPWIISTIKYSHELEVVLESARFLSTSDSLIKRCPDLFSFGFVSFMYAHIRQVFHEARLMPFYAQPNLPAALIWGYLLLLLWRRKQLTRGLTYSSLLLICCALAFSALSIDQAAVQSLPVVYVVQFACRLVSYANLAVLCGLLLALNARAGSSPFKLFAGSDSKNLDKLAVPVITAACLLCAINVWGNLRHITRPAASLPLDRHVFSQRRTDLELLHLPENFSAEDYATPYMVTRLDAQGPALLENMFLRPGVGRSFALAEPQALKAQHQRWLTTSIIAFPWNHILLNGHVVSNDQLRRTPILKLPPPPSGNLVFICRNGMFVQLPPPPPHYGNYLAVSPTDDAVLSYEFAPDLAWDISNRIAYPLFLIWLISSAIGSIIVLKSNDSDQLPALTEPSGRRSGELTAR